MRLRCGDRTYVVGIKEGRDGPEVQVDDSAWRPVVEQTGAGRFVWRDGSRVEPFFCVRDGRTIHLAWGGRTFRIEEEQETSTKAAAHVVHTLEAPMPGKLIRVNVSPGEDVTRGQELLVIEAMKMENAVRAPRDGRVQAVAARVGDLVSPGTPLVELE